MIGLKISARNQMKGRVIEIEKEGLIAKVKISVEPTTITAIYISPLYIVLSVPKF